MDGEIGLLADRAWQVEFGDRWWAEKQKWSASRAGDRQQQTITDLADVRAALQEIKAVVHDMKAACKEMEATFRDMQATLAENVRLREERERRLEDWAIEDAWARLRGGR